MSQNRRVVWSEGMLLAPQHFQQWDRYVHHLVRERFRGVRAFDWGFLQLEVDQEALRNGRIALAAAKGVMPDGTPFAMPDDDALPPARSFDGHFGPKMDALQVSLGLPAARLGRPQLGEVDGSEGRCRAIRPRSRNCPTTTRRAPSGWSPPGAATSRCCSRTTRWATTTPCPWRRSRVPRPAAMPYARVTCPRVSRSGRPRP
jgi:type VI secretion system protein ImpJ